MTDMITIDKNLGEIARLALELQALGYFLPGVQKDMLAVSGESTTTPRTVQKRIDKITQLAKQVEALGQPLNGTHVDIRAANVKLVFNGLQGYEGPHTPEAA